MPETSIVVKSTDRYSDAIKKMSSVTKSFSKDVDKLEDTLYALNKNKITMKMDLSKAKSELKAAEKQFDLTHSAADGLKLELAQANYDNMVRNLKAVTSAARETEKAISKAENSADSGGGGTSFGKSVINALAVSGIGDAAKQILSQGANAIAGSALGDDGGSMFSSALSTAATGASAGFMVGGPAGAAIGAAIGTGVGLVSGGIQIFEKRDDAYKDWYAGLYENAGATTDTGLSSGSTIAGSREQTQMAFAQKLGGDEAANAYLDRVKAMATSTNYSYDEITGYSKLLLNTYDAEKTPGVLQTLSDASAGLNLGSSDVKMFISGLSRMRTSGKATTEYLNYFSERGVDVYQALANSTGKDKSKIPEMVTKGKISGADAAEAILTYINETYGGLSDKLATSYDALTDNLSDVQADIDSAMGEGYNEERSKSIAAQIESYGGELGDALQEANKAIGAGRAALENLADQYTEEALSAVLTGKETALDWSDGNAERLQELAGLYQQAMEDYNNGNTQAGTLVETYLEEARALAEAQYDSSEAVRAQTDAENDMITAIRENTAALGGWKAQYDLSQNLTKGRAATWTATTQTTGTSSGTNTMIANGYGYANVVPRNAIGYAVGIDYVPYDNFPALLHQGEQVLTAEEARSGNGGSGGVQIIMNGVTIREDADIDRVAAALLQKMELAGMRG